MNEQLSFSLSDEVAPYYDDPAIKSLCALIDEKSAKGLKYNDLKQQLLFKLQMAVDLNNPDDSINLYRRTYEFTKYY